MVVGAVQTLREIGAESADLCFLFRAECARTLLLPALQLCFSRGEITQPFLPFGFQPARYQSVFRLHCAILAFGTFGLIARTFYRQAPLTECRIVIRLQLPHCLFGSFDRSWRQRFQKRVRHRMIDLDTTDVETVNASPLDDVFARAVIARRGISAAIVRMQMPATLAAGGQTLQQCGAFSHCTACLVRLGMNVGVDAGLIGLVGCPVGFQD